MVCLMFEILHFLKPQNCVERVNIASIQEFRSCFFCKILIEYVFLAAVQRISIIYIPTFIVRMRSVNDGTDPGQVAEPAAAVPGDQAAATKGLAAAMEDSQARPVPPLHHNWSDLLFIMDVMEDNAVDPCDILVFISKSDDLISVLEDKKVDVNMSKLDVTSGTVTLVYTDAGIIERLLGKTDI